MCGRTALTLDPSLIVSACAYKKRRESKFSKPIWKNESNLGRTYSPSFNVAPTDITPVIVPHSKNDSELVIKPMMWGMVPPWHKGSYKSHGLTTNNCRIETILTSKLYGKSLKENNRCVVIAEGFYEWQTVNKTKQPYYIFSPQIDNLKVYDSNTWMNNFDEINGWNGVKLLKMAALYNKWTCEDGILYSYSIITMESNDTMSFIHHRMPAFLETDDQLNDWLDVENVSANDAIKVLKPVSKLESYMVSPSVNNSRFKESTCNKPVDKNALEQLKSSNSKDKQKAKDVNCGSKNLMNMWLKKKSPLKNKIKDEITDDSYDVKRQKLE